MLPGFRFLFAATLLTVSLLVFGLGAAALLRASHEQFASLPKQFVPTAIFTQTTDAALPALSMLRVETAIDEGHAEPVIAPTPADTLLPTERVATLSAAPRAEEPPPAPPVIVEPKPEVKAEVKPEPPTVEAKIEAKVEAAIEPKAEPVLETQIQIAPISDKADVATTTEALSITKAEDRGKVETPALQTPALILSEPAPQQVAALPERDVTGFTPAPQALIEPPLVNAKPIRKPPTPRDRPTNADVVATLPNSVAVAAPPEAAKPIVRQRRSVVKRVVKPKRRIVSRPAPPRPAAAQNPASPFGATPFGT